MIAYNRAKVTPTEVEDVVVAKDVAKGDLLVSRETQVVLSQEDLVTTVIPNTLQSSIQLSENPATTPRRKDIFLNSATPELALV